MRLFLTLLITLALAGTGLSQHRHTTPKGNSPKPAPQAQSKPGELPENIDLSEIRGLTVQHNGRYMPLETVAMDVIGDITDGKIFKKADPVAMLLAWTLDPGGWQRVQVIPIRNKELRGELELDPDREFFSYRDLIGHKPLHLLVDELDGLTMGKKANPLQKKVGSLRDKLVALQRIYHGQVIRIIPDTKETHGQWGDLAFLAQTRDPSLVPARDAWFAVAAAFLEDDGDKFNKATEAFMAEVQELPAAYRPPPAKIETELRYNRLGLYRKAWIIMALGALLAVLSLIIRKRWFDISAAVVLLIGFGLLTYGMYLRGSIAGHIPASNMFESLLFLSWGAGAFAVPAMFLFRHRSVPLTAAIIGALSLMLADVLPIDHFIRPTAPVLLDTIWMSIHVPVIMFSYAVLAIAVAISHLQVVMMAVTPQSKKLIKFIDQHTYWYLNAGTMLLLAGIVTGSIWAASSWGRYWGWDPKEVWSLVALLGYLTILHVRLHHRKIPKWAMGLALVLGIFVFGIVGMYLAPLSIAVVLVLIATAAVVVIFLFAHGEFATAAKSILAFWMIIMTYVGVNYVLGTGLHSYGFGTGAVKNMMFLIGGIDLGFLALCAVVWGVRRLLGNGLEEVPADVATQSAD